MGPKDSSWECRKVGGLDATITQHVGTIILDTIGTYKFEAHLLTIKLLCITPLPMVLTPDFILFSLMMVFLAGPLGLVIYKREKGNSALIILISLHMFSHFTWRYMCHSKWYSINSIQPQTWITFALTSLKNWATWSFPFKFSFLCSANQGVNGPHFYGTRGYNLCKLHQLLKLMSSSFYFWGRF